MGERRQSLTRFVNFYAHLYIQKHTEQHTEELSIQTTETLNLKLRERQSAAARTSASERSGVAITLRERRTQSGGDGRQSRALVLFCSWHVCLLLIFWYSSVLWRQLSSKKKIMPASHQSLRVGSTHQIRLEILRVLEYDLIEKRSTSCMMAGGVSVNDLLRREGRGWHI
ncbi:hypothetical protein DFH11DRAFT_1556002 [Phellopilus nigrolimitatus]|nr:hypothetical protein DFH11DRAFT_1556002 [Phellopilus nigrolimitatus]